MALAWHPPLHPSSLSVTHFSRMRAGSAPVQCRVGVADVDPALLLREQQKFHPPPPCHISVHLSHVTRPDRIPANTGHSPNVVSMLGQRLRRWPNIETALGFAGYICAEFLIFIFLIQRSPHNGLWYDRQEHSFSARQFYRRSNDMRSSLASGNPILPLTFHILYRPRKQRDSSTAGIYLKCQPLNPWPVVVRRYRPKGI